MVSSGHAPYGMFPDTRPKRESIQEGEWHISAKLIRVSDDHVLKETTVPLRISDARLNNEFNDTSRALGLWLNDQAQALARMQAAAKKARRRR